MKTPNWGKHLPELKQLENIRDKIEKHGDVRLEGEVTYRKITFPMNSFTFGSNDPNAPTLLLVGGVHGLERIGTRVLVAYLESVVELLEWDEVFRDYIDRVRLVFYPIVNPGGMYWKRRSNPQGIDLMRNAPVESDKVSRVGLAAGHRLTPLLPWYRGKKDAPMAIEASTLCQVVERECWNRPLSLSLDVHSGFGTVDRLWFPFAKSEEVFPHVPEVYALKELLDATYPNHIYRIEPQSKQYTAHGDLWDYLYLKHSQDQSPRTFLPLSLELGSWIWVKKNPRQIKNILGVFNPTRPHRLQRTLRRHLILFDFLIRALISNKKWVGLEVSDRENVLGLAKQLWYE